MNCKQNGVEGAPLSRNVMQNQAPILLRTDAISANFFTSDLTSLNQTPL